jgi:hypothetical protein
MIDGFGKNRIASVMRLYRDEIKKQSAPGWDHYARECRRLAKRLPLADWWEFELSGIHLDTSNGAWGDTEKQIARFMARHRCAIMDRMMSQIPVDGWREVRPACEVEITQFSPDPRTDSPNLWTKPLFDVMCANNHGVGVYADDSPRFVSGFTVRYRYAENASVHVLVKHDPVGAFQ